ncbi:MAG: hypothetical protein M1136_05630 [Chloroflexi bacterium]|nr:hypothetical protein [Chloroflexota bacterium]
MRIKIDLSAEATNRLIELAVKECRSVCFEAEVLILRALKLFPEMGPFPEAEDQQDATPEQ